MDLSTTALALQLQSFIAEALDEDNYVLMASIDLSVAFNIVNIDLLLKCLKITGLLADIVLPSQLGWILSIFVPVYTNFHIH